MSQIEVSIVIPTYNRKDMLKEALKRLFDQTYSKNKYELIVCDDGSSDGTEEAIKDLMEKPPCVLRYYKQRNKGLASVRNLGIENARGKIIGFIDDDCIASSTWIEHAVQHFADEKVTGVAGAVLPVSPYRETMFGIVHTRKFIEEGDYAGGNIFYKKKALIDVGGFNPKFVGMREDADLALRLKRKNHEILFSNDFLVYHPVINQSITAYLKSLRKWELEVLFLREHPESEAKKDLIFGFIYKRHIYPIFFVLFITFLMINTIYAGIFLLFGILSYLGAYVFIDSNVKKYPLRIILFIRHFIPDLIRLYYTIRGSIHYRCLFI